MIDTMFNKRNYRFPVGDGKIELNSLICQHINKSVYDDIPSDYTWEHLWKYKCYKLKTSRLKKKFRKNPRKYVGPKVRRYLATLAIGSAAADIIREKSKVEGFARKLLITENYENMNEHK